MAIDYLCTNETLEAINAAMQPEEGDSILSICGSGDQPFMFALAGAKVLAIDINPDQIQLAKWRAESLVKGNRYSFFYEGCDGRAKHVRQRNEFFQKIPNYQERAANLPNIKYVHGDIYEFNPSPQQEFTKIYASNSWANPFKLVGQKSTVRTVISVPVFPAIHRLKEGGVVYFTHPCAFHGNVIENLPLELDKELTERASSLESSVFVPFVYRKTSQTSKAD